MHTYIPQAIDIGRTNSIVPIKKKRWRKKAKRHNRQPLQQTRRIFVRKVEERLGDRLCDRLFMIGPIPAER